MLQDAAHAGADTTLATMARITDVSLAEGDLLWLRGRSAAGAILPLDATGLFTFAGGAALPVGFAGSLAAATAPVAGLALPGTTGGEAYQVYWLPSAVPGDQGGWVVLDADRDGALDATDLVVRVNLAASGALTAAAFAPGTFATVGTTGNNAILGMAEADTIHGLAGNDTLRGAAGNDSLLGGAGADSLLGEAGLDTLRGGESADTLAGGDGVDVLDGGAGDHRLDGGADPDLLLGGVGDDALLGGAGDDTLEAGGDADSLTGGAEPMSSSSRPWAIPPGRPSPAWPS